MSEIFWFSSQAQFFNENRAQARLKKQEPEIAGLDSHSAVIHNVIKETRLDIGTTSTGVTYDLRASGFSPSGVSPRLQ